MMALVYILMGVLAALCIAGVLLLSMPEEY